MRVPRLQAADQRNFTGCLSARSAPEFVGRSVLLRRSRTGEVQRLGRDHGEEMARSSREGDVTSLGVRAQRATLVSAGELLLDRVVLRGQRGEVPQRGRSCSGRGRCGVGAGAQLARCPPVGCVGLTVARSVVREPHPLGELVTRQAKSKQLVARAWG